MTSGPTPSDGVSRFIADLEDESCDPVRAGDVVRYSVVPAAGTFAGKNVLTGISVAELQGWPTAPPHWIHLEDQVTFDGPITTDVQDCPLGWSRHSRDVGPWVMDRKPIHIWLAHVRCVLGQAV